MLSERSSGILLHPTSLPSRGGIGDFGPAAYEFVDWLAAAKQTLVADPALAAGGLRQLALFLYLCVRRQHAVDQPGTTGRARLAGQQSDWQFPDGDSPVDYDSVRDHKLPLLREAAAQIFEVCVR